MGVDLNRFSIKSINEEDAKKIISSRDIWLSAAEDTVNLEDFSFDREHAFLLVKEIACDDSQQTIGIIFVEQDTGCAISMHPYAFREHRFKMPKIMDEFFKWFLSYSNESLLKVHVNIPSCFMSTINFARKIGFQDEGVRRMCYIKGGELYDIVMMGITREQIEEEYS